MKRSYSPCRERFEKSGMYALGVPAAANRIEPNGAQISSINGKTDSGSNLRKSEKDTLTLSTTAP